METTRQVPPSLIKIQLEVSEHMPNSSATLCPATNCRWDVVKHLKPRERTASIDSSSVNSSETSDPLLGDDIESSGDADAKKEEAKEFVGENDRAKTTTRSFRMQTHLRGMQRRLELLQTLMQEAAQPSSLRTCFEGCAMKAAKPCLVLAEMMEENNDNDQLADLQPSAPKERVGDFLGLDSTSRSKVVLRTRNDELNDGRDDRTDSGLASSGEEDPNAIATLLHRIKALQAQLKKATDENQQLQHTVCKLEQDNARLHAQTASLTPERVKVDSGSAISKCISGYGIGNTYDRNSSCLDTAMFGVPSLFQIEMEEDLKFLRDHERCQHKLHELWDSVRQLKMLVEINDIERNAMKAQRDDAIAEAERADIENLRLASSNNLQQKIKYLQQMKKDNQALRRKNRALNVRIVKEAVKLVREKSGCSLHEDSDLTLDTMDSVLLGDPLHDFDDSSVRTGEEILRSMQDFSRHLEQRLQRLRLARQDLLQDDDDDLSEALELEGR